MLNKNGSVQVLKSQAFIPRAGFTYLEQRPLALVLKIRSCTWLPDVESCK